ncbi:hypothetical protein [Paenibacillus sinopodophylli]|uniref:hypothetical protein n=1 Tax=Paenibacillus sinopodophylli TaxID=1837342 RepID=UPI00110CF978|nr:hypothetical protein [Paenibacillus sinopodophylli]
MAMPLLNLNNVSLYCPPDAEEILLIERSILLPLALAAVERNRLDLDRRARSLRAIFAKAADLIIAQMKTDLIWNTKLLISMGITVCIVSTLDGKLSYRYNFRGFEQQVDWTSEYIRNEINKLISAYNAAIFSKDVHSSH